MNIVDLHLNSLILKEPIYNSSTDMYISDITFDSKRINFKTPRLRVIDLYDSQLEIQFTLNCSDFYEKIYNIDDYIIDQLVTYGQQWFGTPVKHRTIENLFRRTTIIRKNLKDLPKMIFQVSNTCNFIGRDGRNVHLDTIVKNNEVELIIELESVNFYPNMYWLVYKVVELQVTNYCCDSANYLFTNTESTESTDEQDIVDSLSISDNTNDDILDEFS